MLILKPKVYEKVWGGSKLGDIYGYDIPNSNIGECWAISGMVNASNVIVNGEFEGKFLSDVYEQNRELFGNCTSNDFPLLVKIIDAKDKLSIQVHPNDIQANEFENYSYGKSECWYVLDAGENKKLIYGHNAKDYEEMKFFCNYSVAN
ncbi:MAG: hypothetical protein KAX49_16515 [Halanaerobiales bacterium]|nr:hypothetical protein [Halanaerobiales bacterium]